MKGHETIEFNTERQKTENEILLEKIMPIFSKLQYKYDFGGGEDEEGELMPGNPDFNEAKKELEELLPEAPTGLREKTLEFLDSLSKKFAATDINEGIHFKVAIDELENIYLDDLSTKEQIAIKETLLKTQQENLSGALDEFIENSILHFPPGSSERRIWGNALRDYRAGNPQSLIDSLEDEAKKNNDQQAKEWLRFLKFNQPKESDPGDVVVYPPTGSFR